MAADDRSKKLKRLVAVQRHLERMSEGELAEVTRQRSDVDDSIDRVVGAISSVDAVHMAFSRQYAHRLGHLTLRTQQLDATQKMIETNLLKERTKGDRLEEHMLDARAQEQREAEDNAIYDLIDQQLAAATPASSKVEKP